MNRAPDPQPARPEPQRLEVYTNRHPNTDGTPWGWVEDENRRRVACWSGEREREEWQARAHALRATPSERVPPSPEEEEPHPLECPDCGDDINKCGHMSEDYRRRANEEFAASPEGVPLADLVKRLKFEGWFWRQKEAASLRQGERGPHQSVLVARNTAELFEGAAAALTAAEGENTNLRAAYRAALEEFGASEERAERLAAALLRTGSPASLDAQTARAEAAEERAGRLERERDSYRAAEIRAREDWQSETAARVAAEERAERLEARLQRRTTERDEARSQRNEEHEARREVEMAFNRTWEQIPTDVRRTLSDGGPHAPK